MKRLLLLGLWLTLTVNQMALTQPIVRLYGVDGTNTTSASNPLPVNASVTVDSIESITDPVGVLGANGSAITSSTNPFPIRLSVDGTNFMDATHGGYFNLVQGNTVISDANPVPFSLISDGNPVGNGNPMYVQFATSQSVLVANDTLLPLPLMGKNGLGVATSGNAVPIQIYGNDGDFIGNGGSLPVTVGGYVKVALPNDDPVDPSHPFSVAVNGTSGTAISSPGNPLDVRPSADGTNPVDATHPLATQLSQADAAVTDANPIPAQLSQANAALTAQNPIFAAPSGVVQASITNTNTAIPDSSTQVTLTAASAHIRIHNNSATETLYVDLTDDTATSADYAILPGDSMEPYDGAPLTGFKVIGTNAADTYNVLAW
jgi:hypothetical protein